MTQKRIQLLLVEDEHVDQRAFERLIQERRLPYDMTLAESVEEALQALDSQPFDVVVADYYLCDGTAMEVLEINETVPVIVITGTGDEQIAVEAIKLGALDYVVKSPEVFANTPKLIKRVLREWQNMEETKNASLIFEEVATGFIRQKDETYFDALARSLAYSLEAEVVMVGEFVGAKNENIKTLSYWKDGSFSENFEIKVEETPCYKLYSEKLSVYEKNLQEGTPAW